MDERDPVERSLTDIDQGSQRTGTMREVRPEFQREGVTRPMSGATLMERLKGRISERLGARPSDTSRSQNRR